jgi:hypothetical protein
MLASEDSDDKGTIMVSELEPVVGQWYVQQDKGDRFRIVAIDLATASIEIQRFDGDIEEIELDVWQELDLTPVEAPEDWTGPYDELPDDLEYSSSDAGPKDWRLSLEREPPPGAWREARVVEDIV